MAIKENGKKFEIDFDAVSRLVDLVKQSKVGRIKVSCSGFEVEVESKKDEVVLHSSSNRSLGDEIVVEADGGALLENEKESGNLVQCPIVGTFYSSPAPGKPEFVRVGDSVEAGDVLFIIESMKLMNEVKSEFSGVVKKIFVNSGDPVEFGQSIMLIE